MRLLTLIFTSSLLHLPAFGQQEVVTADTFNFVKRYLHEKIVARSDSTFYMRRKSCTYSRFEMGTYEKLCNNLILTLYRDIVVETHNSYLPADYFSLFTTFVVRDCMGHPIENFEITLIDKLPYDTSVFTNNNGEAVVERTKYKRYFTELDEENETFKSVTPLGHFLPYNANTVNVTLCVPTEKKENYRKRIIQLSASSSL